jgi:hypothetical protein
MLTGKRFTLRKETLALLIAEGRRTAVQIPTGAIVKVVSGPKNSDGIVDVLWEGRTVAMFLVDVEARGTEITEQGQGASN